MALVVTTRVQGLAVPDPAINEENITPQGVAGTSSSYTQAGNKAGLPVPSQVTAMTLDATGLQTEGGDQEVYTLRSGNPGYEEGGFIHRNVTRGDAVNQYLGWNPYAVVADAASLFRSPGTGAGGSLVDVLRLDDGTVLMAHQKASAASGIEVQQYDPATGAWSVLGILATVLDALIQPCPCMVQLLPEETVLFFALADEGRNVIVARSEPDFSNLNFAGAQALRVDLPDGCTVTEMRAAFNNDQIVLFVRYTPGGGGDEIAQYASSDRGAHFEQVTSVWSVVGDFPDSMSVTPLVGGGFLFVYSDGVPGALVRYRSRRIGSAYEDVQNAADVALAALTVGATPSVTTWSDEDGIVYAAAAFTEAASSGVRLFRSINRGDSWDTWGAPICELDPGKVTSRFVEFAATSTAGRGIFVTRYVSGDAESISAVLCLFLGGPSRVTVPATDEDVGGVPIPTTNFPDVAFITWATSDDNAKAGGFYAPVDVPQNMGWTKAGAGAETVQADQTLLVSTAVQAASYFRTHAGDFRRVFAMFRNRIKAGDGDLTQPDDGFRVRLADNGGYQYTVTIRIDDTGLRVYDDEGVAIVGSVTGLDLTTDFYVAIAMEGSGGGAASGAVLVWYMQTGNAIHAHRWIPLIGGTLDDGGVTANDNRIEFANIQSSTADDNWGFVGYSFWPSRWSATDDVSTPFASTHSNPNSLHPRSYSPLPLLLEDDVHIVAKSGPSYIPDKWRITPAFDYAFTNIIPASNPSPRRGWRSLADNVQQLGTWLLDPDFLSRRLLNHSLAFLILNSNLEQVLVETSATGAAWVVLTTLDATDGWTPLEYDRRGATIIPRAGTVHSGSRYLWHSAHVGDTFVLNEEGSKTFHKIRANTEGAWIGSQSNTKKPTIVLERDNLPGALAVQAFGTGEIRRKDFGGIVHSYNLDHPYIRLRIPAQFTADGDYRIGQAPMCYLAAFAHEYDSGWSITREFDSEVFRRRGGTRRARKNGPSRRVVEIAWAETAVDASRAQVDAPDPDYVVCQTAVALAIGSVQDAVRMVEGVHIEQDGPVSPVVYLGRVPTDANATHPLEDWREFVYGRLETENLRIDNVTGDEGVSELERLNTITIREEV